MVLKNVLFIIISCICFSVIAQNNKDIKKIKKIIYTLAADSMQGRASSSIGEQKAKNYLSNYFKEMKLTNTNIHKFTFPKDSMHIETAYNISGYIDNKTDSTIIIGAHYDHLGLGGSKSMSLTSSKIHNGADDNASGVAIMLMLAEYLQASSIKHQITNKYNYLFIAFSAHEDCLCGSQAFINDKIYDLDRVKLMLNFDMVGRLDAINPVLKVIKRENNKYLDTLLCSINHNKFQIKIDESNISRSDATAFASLSIPAVSFTTGIHDDYHKISDKPEKINFEGMYQILEYCEGFLFEFNKTKEGKIY